MRSEKYIWLLIAFALIPQMIVGMTWGFPEVRTYVSQNGEYLYRVSKIKVESGTSYQAIQYRFNSEKNEYFESLRFDLVKFSTPQECIVLDSGTLVCLGIKHISNPPNALMIYSPDGLLRKSYSLEDLFSAEHNNLLQDPNGELMGCWFIWAQPVKKQVWIYPTGGGLLIVDENGEFKFEEDGGFRFYFKEEEKSES